MKKPVLLVAAFFALAATPAFAQSATTSTNPSPAKVMIPKNAPPHNRMKDCAAEYHKKGLPSAQYKSFMSTCLRSKPTGTGSGTGAGSNGAPKTP